MVNQEKIERYMDKNIEKMVNELISEMYPPETLDNRDCQHRCNLAKKKYFEILKDMRVSDLTPSFLVSCVPTLSQKEASYLIRVCIKLSEYGFKNDLARLVEFKERIAHVAWPMYKTDIIHIFESDDFEYFKHSGLLKTEDGMKLFFSDSNIADIIDIVKDEELRGYIKDFIKVIKKSEQYTVKTRILQILQFREIINIVSAYCIDEWSRKMFLNVKQKILCLRFLEYISGKRVLPDNISKMVTFKEYLTTKSIILTGWRKICNDDINQYFIIEYQSNDKSLVALYHTDIPYNTELFNDMKDYLRSNIHKTKEIKIFVEKFILSTGKEKIESVTDLSYETYLSSGKYVSEYDNAKKYYSYISTFYTFLINKYNIELFAENNIANKIFLRPGALNLLIQGYSIEYYNPLDGTPLSDKWFLMYDAKYDTGTYHKASDSMAIDFSDIHNELFKKLAKSFLWHYNISINKKATMLLLIKEALNYIDDLRKGQKLSIYCKNKVEEYGNITENEAYAYKMYVRATKKSEVTAANAIYDFSRFLKVIKENNEMDVQESVFRFLKTKCTLENNSNAIPDKELKKLIKVVEEHAENDVKGILFSLIFKIALDTEMRISEILSLDVDCVSETSKEGEYILIRKRKSRTIEKEIEPITSETKRVIDKAIANTKEYRDNAPLDIKNKLFIVPSDRMVQVRCITLQNFRKYMIACCEEAKVEKYTASNLRDTHMTKARLYKIQHEISDLEHSVLTGHSTKNVDMVHYVDISIETMLESVYGIIIGDVDINGQIVNKLDSQVANTENEVSNGCGYCSSKNCDNLTYMDCLMCKSFVTMPSKLYFFEKQLEVMDEKIENSTFPHDKEDAVNIKRLLVKYIAKIKKLEGDRL